MPTVSTSIAGMWFSQDGADPFYNQYRDTQDQSDPEDPCGDPSHITDISFLQFWIDAAY